MKRLRVEMARILTRRRCNTFGKALIIILHIKKKEVHAECGRGEIGDPFHEIGRKSTLTDEEAFVTTTAR